ncbi:acetyltransferase EpsM [Anseongella ginsenosidimutans]|uniref:Acetyltransferase EpsM n=1 Tax=Anseongella ginsenosidimutans TaxID=496056 RepID=A0A4R3KNT8_9SPHI|nr:acetyltransferase [Anseongella ginsenosidimutans]QEC52148.1 acetyltransferase [Anseongella ginsenosidimutans]TCS84823.1 acetyltransferase EpsM [Anseongella ginsenosidimutans]
MFLYGAGGHAKVILEILESRGILISGLLDDRDAISELFGYPVKKYKPGMEIDHLLLAIGNNLVRKNLATEISTTYGTAIHPSAIISERSHIGEGSVVMAGAIISASAKIGRHCIINVNAVVDHDCRVADFAHVAPGACLCGGAEVGEGAWIGAGSVVKSGVRIGDWVQLAPGSVVLEDISS